MPTLGYRIVTTTAKTLTSSTATSERLPKPHQIQLSRSEQTLKNI